MAVLGFSPSPEPQIVDKSRNGAAYTGLPLQSPGRLPGLSAGTPPAIANTPETRASSDSYRHSPREDVTRMRLCCPHCEEYGNHAPGDRFEDWVVCPRCELPFPWRDRAPLALEGARDPSGGRLRLLVEDPR
jgi:uncharacterized protein YbaR (Trm112 family)